MFLLSCVLYLCLYVILTELNKNNVRQFPHKRSPSSDDPLRPGGVGSVGVVVLREVVVRLWGVTSACRAAAEDVSMFPSPKLSDESIGSDSASLSVSLSRANETESAAENLKSFFCMSSFCSDIRRSSEKTSRLLSRVWGSLVCFFTSQQQCESFFLT